MFKIGAIRELESAEYELRNPKTNAGLGVFLMLAGPGHEKRVAFDAARVERQQASFKKSGVVELPGYEEQQAQTLELVCASVLGWRGLEDEFSPKAVRAWLGQPDQKWAVRQIANALADSALFISDSGDV